MLLADFNWRRNFIISFYILQRELILAFRHRSEILQPIGFFVLVVSLFPLAMNADNNLLKISAGGIIWVAALLATLLALPQLFRNDFDDGSLEQLVMSPYPVFLLVMMKIFSFWLIIGLPLVIISPILGLLLHLSLPALKILLLSLLLGTPVLCLIGAIGAALILNLTQASLLLALIILPLYVPVLIFGAGAINNALIGLPVSSELFFLSALLTLAITLAPLAITAAIRMSIQGN